MGRWIFFSGLTCPEAVASVAIFVHDDAHGQGNGRQQEGAHGERQVQHLVLVLADGPAVHLQVLLRRAGFVGFGEVKAGAVLWRKNGSGVGKTACHSVLNTLQVTNLSAELYTQRWTVTM